AEVFRFDKGGWSGPTQLDLGSVAVGPGRSTGDGDGFGWAVGLSANGDTALIGAPFRAFNNEQHAGAAYVFRSSGSDGWTGPTELSLGSSAHGEQAGEGGDTFGISLALSGDGNLAVIGAPGRGAGSIETFRFAAGNWSAPAELSA